MRIVIAPVLVGDRICRIVSPVDSLLEVEEWVGEWWEPSTVTLTLASQAPAAPESLLQERGVPPEDRAPSGPRPDAGEIQALLRAREPHAAEPPTLADAGAATRAHGARRRNYSGNARFRRAPAAPGLDRADLRREEPATEWKGPWRRASDRAAPPREDRPTS